MRRLEFHISKVIDIILSLPVFQFSVTNQYTFGLNVASSHGEFRDSIDS